MAVIPLRNRGKLDELSPMAKFVLTSYYKNQLDFAGFSDKYTVAHGDDIELERKVIDALINPVQLTSELKMITQRIYTNQVIVASSIDFLEGYAKRAIGLTIASKDFGFGDVRTSNNSGDIEGVVKNIRTVAKNAANNMAALVAQGYSAAKQTYLIGLADALETDNAGQNSKMDDRHKLVSENHVAINNFWDSINDLCEVGKILYKDKTNENRPQYVVTTVLARMRSDAAKTAIIGSVAPKARLEFKPLGAGRKRVAKAGPKGDYAVKGITPGEYQGTLIVKGKPNVVKHVVVEVGGHVVENFA